MSRTSKIVPIVAGAVWCMLSAGPIFGFSALKPILSSQGVYNRYCSEEEINNSVVCPKQDHKLNNLYVYCVVCTYAAYLFAASIVNAYGPRSCAAIGSTVLFAGSLILSIAGVSKDSLVCLGLVIFATGGPFVFFSTLHLAGNISGQAPLILSIFMGAMDSSAGVFSIYRYVYEHVYKYSLSQFFGLYLLVPLLILASQLVLPDSRNTVGSILRMAHQKPSGNSNNSNRHTEDQDSETSRLLSNNDDMEIDFTTAFRRTSTTGTLNDVIKDPTEVSGVFGVLHDSDLSNQLFSFWFVFIVGFTLIQMLIINSFIPTNYEQNHYILDSIPAANRLSRFFDVGLPLGGLVGIAFISPVLDSVPTIVVFSICTIASALLTLLSLIPWEFVAEIRMTLFSLYRPFFFATVADYCAKVFGFDTYSIVYSLIMLLSGLGNCFNLYFDWLTYKVLHGNPVPVNILFCVLSSVVGSLFLIHIWRQSKYIRRKQLEDEARHAPVQNMPGSAYNSITDNSHPQNDCESGGCDNCVCEV